MPGMTVTFTKTQAQVGKPTTMARGPMCRSLRQLLLRATARHILRAVIQITRLRSKKPAEQPKLHVCIKRLRAIQTTHLRNKKLRVIRTHPRSKQPRPTTSSARPEGERTLRRGRRIVSNSFFNRKRRNRQRGTQQSQRLFAVSALGRRQWRHPKFWRAEMTGHSSQMRTSLLVISVLKLLRRQI